MPVIGEPFKEVSPGFLPRTLDQLRAGLANDARRPENRLRRRRLSSDEERPEEPQQSLESALDSLLAEASDDETPRPTQQVATPVAQTPQPTAQPRPMNRGEARLARARERFARTFGTREEVQQDDYESPLSTIFNRADDRYRQAQERRRTDTTSPPPLDGLSAQERREIEDQLLWGVMRDSTTHHELEAENNVWSYTPRRVETANFVDGENDYAAAERTLMEQLRAAMPEGTPEESSSLLYPTTSDSIEAEIRLAHRNFGRHQARQNFRSTAPITPNTNAGPSQPRRFPVLPSTSSTSTMGRSQPAALPTWAQSNTRSSRSPSQHRSDDFQRLQRQFDLFEESEHEVERRNDPAQASSSATSAGPSSSNGNGNGMTQIQTSISQITSELQRLRLASEAITSARHSMHSRFTHTEHPVHTLDNPDRPAPLSDEEMTKTLACQVCYQQLADVAVLPCGHMVMCQWCADVVIPVKHSHLPIRQSKCPMCRKLVKQRFRIHM